MEENKFERQVQQKMDDLRMHPSNSVWEHVKIRIEKKKNRRSTFLIFSLIIIILMSGGYWLFDSSHQTVRVKKAANNIDSKNDASKTWAVKKYNSKEEKDKIQPTSLSANPDSNIKAGIRDNLNKKNKKNFLQRTAIKKHRQQNMAVVINSAQDETVNLIEKSDEKITLKLKSESAENSQKNSFIANLKNDSIRIDVISKKIVISKMTNQGIAKEDTLDGNAEKKVPLNPMAKSKWHLGVIISGGISHVGNQFLGFGYTPADYLQNANTPGGRQISNPSKVKNGGAFVIGSFIEKNISSKAILSFGIDYKVFNTSNLVGQKNDSSGTFSSGNLVHRYYNNFKFIELPLWVKVQIGKSKTFPLFWNGGIILSQLITSNALQFDPSASPLDPDAKAYFKDNKVFNKTQVGFSTGLLTAFLQNKKSSILLGPYFYYEASKLANEGLYNKKHFVFIGLRSEILFGRE